MKPVFAISAAAISLLLAGCKAGEPGKVEKSVATEVKHRVRVGEKDGKNPARDPPEPAKEGAEHSQHHCQICRGLDGQAPGVPFATKMPPPVPDLTSKDVQDYTDGQLKWIIENGIAPSGMPAWKEILDQDEVWKIVDYLRHLPPRGGLATPQATKEEAEEHEAVKAGTKQDESKPHTHTHSHSHSAEPKN